MKKIVVGTHVWFSVPKDDVLLKQFPHEGRLVEGKVEKVHRDSVDVQLSSLGWHVPHKVPHEDICYFVNIDRDGISHKHRWPFYKERL